MAGMYPDEHTIEVFGEQVKWPGLDPDTKKFTNGSFTDPLSKPSIIPAETINLVLDNLSELIRLMGGNPENRGINQLADLFTSGIVPQKGIIRDEGGRARIADPVEDGDMVNLHYFNNALTGTIVFSALNDYELGLRRLLPLEGQKVEVPLYTNLVDAVWQGIEENETAQSFYRCNADGIRNPAGPYFKLPDARGRVLRGCGQGDYIADKDGAATNDKYDGKNTGDCLGDTIRNITGFIRTTESTSNPYTGGVFYSIQSEGALNLNNGSSGARQLYGFNTSLVVPTASWNRDASLSARICIYY